MFYPKPTHREFVEWLQRQNNQFKIRIKVDNEEGIQAKDVLSYFQQLFDAYSGSDRQGLRVGYYTKRSRGEYHHLKRPGRKQFIEGLTQAEIGETVKFFISSELKSRKEEIREELEELL